MRANLPDPREDLDDFEVGLIYQTPVKPESHEKQREILRESLKG